MSDDAFYNCPCGARLGFTNPGFDRRQQLKRHSKTKRHRAYRELVASPKEGLLDGE